MATQWFFWDLASDVVDNFQSGTKRMMYTVRNSPRQDYYTSTTAGPATLQIGQGSVLQTWYTPELNAVTIAGAITVVLRGYESNMSANVGFRVRIEKWSNNITTLICEKGSGSELGTATGGSQTISFTAAEVTDTVLATHDRLKITVMGEDAGGTMASGYQFVFAANGPTNDGDSNITFTENVTEYVIPTLTLPWRDDFERYSNSWGSCGLGGEQTTVDNSWSATSDAFDIDDSHMFIGSTGGAAYLAYTDGQVSTTAFTYVEMLFRAYDFTNNNGLVRLFTRAATTENLAKPYIEISLPASDTPTVTLYVDGVARASTYLRESITAVPIYLGISTVTVAGVITVKGYVDRVEFGSYSAGDILGGLSLIGVSNGSGLGAGDVFWIQALSSVPATSASAPPAAEWTIGALAIGGSTASSDTASSTLTQEYSVYSKYQGGLYSTTDYTIACDGDPPATLYSDTQRNVGYYSGYVSNFVADHIVYELAYGWDPPVDAGTAVRDACLIGWGMGLISSGPFMIEAYAHDFPDSSPTLRQLWRSSTEVQAMTKVGEFEAPGDSSGTINQESRIHGMTSAALASHVQSKVAAGQRVKVLVTYDRQRIPANQPLTGYDDLWSFEPTLVVESGVAPPAVNMPVLLTSGSSTTATNAFSTASVSATGPTTLIAVVASDPVTDYSDDNGGIRFLPPPTLANWGGCSWQLIRSCSPNHYQYVHVFMLRLNSGSQSGAVTINFPDIPYPISTSNPQSAVSWMILRVPDVTEGGFLQSTWGAQMSSPSLTQPLLYELDDDSMSLGVFMAAAGSGSWSFDSRSSLVATNNTANFRVAVVASRQRRWFTGTFSSGSTPIAAVAAEFALGFAPYYVE